MAADRGRSYRPRDRQGLQHDGRSGGAQPPCLRRHGRQGSAYEPAPYLTTAIYLPADGWPVLYMIAPFRKRARPALPSAIINPRSRVKSMDPPPPPPPDDEPGALTVTVACALLLDVSGSAAAETAVTDALA